MISPRHPLAPLTPPARRTGRAAPMAPDERRRAIIGVVVDLLLEQGPAVTTKQIAEAAGIAEGTIFRVFDDKPALLTAAAEEILNPTDGRTELATALEGLSDLRPRVLVTIELLQARSERVMAVMMALREVWMTQRHDHRPDHARGGPPQFMVDAQRALLERLVEVFEPHRDELSVEPRTAALLLRTLVLGARHPGAGQDATLTPDQIADCLLDGVRARDPLPDTTQTPWETTDMLLRVLRLHLAPYKPQLGVVVLLQFVGTMAALFLPSLNADIIDKGVARRRHRLHRPHRRRDARGLAAPDPVQRRRGVLRRADRDGLRARPALGAVPPGRRLLEPRGVRSSARPRSSPATPTTCSRCRCSC